MNLFLKSLFAVLLAAFSSSCMVSVNGHPVAGIGFGGPGGHGRGRPPQQCGPQRPGYGHGGGGRQQVRMRHYHQRGHQCNSRCHPLSGGGGGHGGGQYSQGGGYRQGGGYSSGYSGGGYGSNNHPYHNYNYGSTRGYGQGSGYQPGQYAGNDRAGRPTYLHGYVGEDGFTPTGAHPR